MFISMLTGCMILEICMMTGRMIIEVFIVCVVCYTMTRYGSVYVYVLDDVCYLICWKLNLLRGNCPPRAAESVFVPRPAAVH